MGITGKLVRSVFSGSRSSKTHENHHIKVKNNWVDKKRWSPVRTYLCGDDFNSVLAEEDSASFKSSEATVTQPVVEDSTEKGEEVQSLKRRKGGVEAAHSPELIELKEAAATTIQSAFRRFMVRCQYKTLKCTVDNEEFLAGKESPSRVSMTTSIEVQTGNSIGVLSIQEEYNEAQNRPHLKPKPQVFRPKEDWDDSTVDSSVSKMRVQHRLEAMTRRERALAYAFSQQLRIRTKIKEAKTAGRETNTSLNWLDRWMATRQTEGSSAESQLIQLETHTSEQGHFLRKKFLELSFEGKESCGSNEVPVPVEGLATYEPEKKDRTRPTKTRLTGTKTVSRRKTFPAHPFQNDHIKASKKDSLRDCEKDKKQKAKHVANAKGETTCKQPSSELFPLQMGPQGDENSKCSPRADEESRCSP